jgi:glycosyltransferase involved in cell wall biosynthesis
MQTSTIPVVSVIMATYNRASLIGHAIESVIDQSFLDWELIIADDGSTDNTAEVLRAWEAKEPRIRYLQLPHAGRIAVVSNAALDAVRGRYIAVLDDDDRWIDPEKLSKQIAFLDEHPDHVACAGGFTIVNRNDERTADIYKPESDEAMRKIALLANPIANSTAMFRASLNERYDVTLQGFADWDFWLKLGREGKMYNFRELFLAYKMWSGNGSFVQQRANASCAVKIVRRYRNDYPGYGKAICFARTYLTYTFLPISLRRGLNSFLSSLKKRIFVHSARRVPPVSET